MRIAIFGLGYVGTVCGTCLAAHGHTVTGVDVHTEKVNAINLGHSPVVEPGLQARLSDVVKAGTLKATSDAELAIRGAEAILICVGTPTSSDGQLNLKFVDKVVRQIGTHLSTASNFPVIAIRSTVPPGTVKRCSQIIADTSGLVPGEDFGVAVNPEFLREGSALADFEDPPYTLVGTDHDAAIDVLRRLYHFLDAPFIECETGSAEIIKYITNSFHALKVAFANEVGTVCKSYGIDSHQVMDLLCRDTKLNISPAYLKPGFAYGGSCLPKDLDALNAMARIKYLEVPLLANIAASNTVHLANSERLVRRAGNKRIGFLGLGFKAHTDDLRESPSVKTVETLLERGYEVRIFDPHVNLSRLIGSNRAYARDHINHLADLLVGSVEELATFAETIVVTNNDDAYSDILGQLNGHHTIIDMTRLPDSPPTSNGRYHGICW